MYSSMETIPFADERQVKTSRRLLGGILALKRGRAGPWLGAAILLAFVGVALFSDFLAPYDYRAQARMEPSAPPSAVHFRDAKGDWHFRPFLYARKVADPLARTYVEDPSTSYR